MYKKNQLMDTRCLNCGRKYVFQYKKAFKLSLERCKCGGKLERINHNYNKYNFAGLYKSKSGYFFFDSKADKFLLAAF
jgi:hypothetical protein